MQVNKIIRLVVYKFVLAIKVGEYDKVFLIIQYSSDDSKG